MNVMYYRLSHLSWKIIDRNLYLIFKLLKKRFWLHFVPIPEEEDASDLEQVAEEAKYCLS